MNYRTYFRKIYQVLIVCSLILISINGWTQPEPREKVVPQAAAPEIDLSRKVTIDADDAFLPSVLSELAEQSGYNIVTGPGVTEEKKLSVHLKNTPIGEAINLVVRACGLSYEIVGRSFLVAETDILTADEEVGLEPYLINLEYAKAEEVKNLVSDITEKVQVDVSSNSLLITATPRIIEQIKTIVKNVDVPPLQIMMEAKIIELSTNDAEKYGIDWERLSSLTTILAEDFYFNEQGVPPGATFTPNTGDLETGTFDGYSSFPANQKPEEMYFQKLDGFNNIGHFSRQLTAFDVTLDFLLRKNIAKVVANTRLTTMNNREASIIIGEMVPYIIQVAGSEYMQQQIEREEVGTKINVLPSVNRDGYITLEITPEVSNIIDFINGNLPHTRVRRATTTVIAKDGNQVVVGGFLQIDKVRSKHQLPILGNLPFIGKMFQHSYVTEKRSELLIEITPHILVNGEEIDSTELLESYPLIKRNKELEQQELKTLEEEK